MSIDLSIIKAATNNAELSERDVAAAEYLLMHDSEWNIAKGKNTAYALMLLCKLKGTDRSWSRLSDDTGVKKSILSRIYRANEIRITPKVAYDLTHNCRKGGEPRNGVTYQDLLMVINETHEQYIIDSITVDVFDEDNNESAVNRIQAYTELLSRREESRSRAEKHKAAEDEFEKRATALLLFKLAQLPDTIRSEKISTSEISDDKNIKYAVRIDDLKTNEQSMKWGFYYMPKIDGVNRSTAARVALEKIMLSVKPDKVLSDGRTDKTAVTIITDSRAYFEELREYSLRYYGDLNVLLLDADKLEFSDSLDLSSYGGRLNPNCSEVIGKCVDLFRR